nr:hypothetical protein [Tanacetum cinerariifolium]
GGVKFYLFPRFLQVFLDKKLEGMARHKEMYIISSHTKKIFANMSLQEQVLDLQEAKAAQAKEISALKKKVTKLNKSRKSRSRGLGRLKKFCSEIGLDDETQGRTNNDEMFGVDDLAGEEVVMDTTIGEHEEQIIED